VWLPHCGSAGPGAWAERFGNDEIWRGGYRIAGHGDTQFIAPWEVYVHFDDSDLKVFDPPRVFHTFRPSPVGWPHELGLGLGLVLVLVEKDSGGMTDAIEVIAEAIRRRIMAACDDDVFVLQHVTLSVPNPNMRFSDSLNSAPNTLRCRDHHGSCERVCDWHIAGTALNPGCALKTACACLSTRRAPWPSRRHNGLSARRHSTQKPSWPMPGAKTCALGGCLSRRSSVRGYRRSRKPGTHRRGGQARVLAQQRGPDASSLRSAAQDRLGDECQRPHAHPFASRQIGRSPCRRLDACALVPVSRSARQPVSRLSRAAASLQLLLRPQARPGTAPRCPAPARR
jgi:hypothetical protein